MEGAAVGVHFDSVYLFLDLSDGQAVRFPLDWFPVLRNAGKQDRARVGIEVMGPIFNAMSLVSGLPGLTAEVTGKGSRRDASSLEHMSRRV
jgi:hypothetical protein